MENYSLLSETLFVHSDDEVVLTPESSSMALH